MAKIKTGTKDDPAHLVEIACELVGKVSLHHDDLRAAERAIDFNQGYVPETGGHTWGKRIELAMDLLDPNELGAFGADWAVLDLAREHLERAQLLVRADVVGLRSDVETAV